MTEISAQVSLYPLEQADITEAIDAFIAKLADRGLPHEVHRMSTLTHGDDETVMAALQAAYRRAIEYGPAVMVLTVTNACPALPDEICEDESD